MLGFEPSIMTVVLFGLSVAYVTFLVTLSAMRRKP